MPVELDRPLRLFDQESFHEIDRQVMRVAFDIHNEFGRFLDELLYKREIETRCRELGFSVVREFGIHVSHGSFNSRLAVDLLVSDGIVFEVKTVESLAPAHELQTLNYLFLTGTQHAKLINLRPDRVQWRFVSTRLTPDRRRQLKFTDHGWRGETTGCRWFRDRLVSLLQDWGGFLESSLYAKAITHELGGEDRVHRWIPIYSGERVVGEQRVNLLDDTMAFAITSLPENRLSMELNLQRFLDHTTLRGMAWANLAHHDIQFTTLFNNSGRA